MALGETYKEMNMDKEEIREQMKETCENYVAGRKMALSFKPLTMDDVKDAFMSAVEEVLQLL